MNYKANIGIVDYGMGNIGSIVNILKKIGCLNVNIISERNDFTKAEKIILPGVGSFDSAIEKIDKKFSIDFLKEKIITKNVPTLGICLGMQILTQSSEEGKLAGLSLVKAKTKKITSTNGLKIPHMGWNYVNVKKKENLCDGLDNKDFYFVHSYYVECENEQDVLLETNYHKSFTSAFSSGNIYGVQFHPEKSHKHGFKLFENFIKIC